MLSPREYVLTCIHAYPTLYAKGEYPKAQRAIFNQLFNVIGNGIRDEEELMAEVNQKFDTTVDYDRYISGEPLFIGYTRLDQEMTERRKKPCHDYHSDIPGAYKESEKESIGALHGVVLWEPLYKKDTNIRLSAFDEITEYKWSPYPNFDEKYSIVWDDYFSKLGVEWIDAASEFYTQCLEYFNGDCANYHYAYPCDTKSATESRDRDLLKFISDKDKYPDNASISKAYGAEYTGDIQEFQTRRWEIEKSRTLDFIGRTLDRLGQMKLELNTACNMSV